MSTNVAITQTRASMNPSPAAPVNTTNPALKTAPLGHLYFDQKQVEAAIAIAAKQPMNPAYSEFALLANPGKPGVWVSQMLANWSGNDGDGQSREYEGCAKWTALGNSLPYLKFKILDTFHIENLKSVRLFWAVSGFIRGHRDYKEFDKGGFTRIHIPLQTNDLCMNSEGALVYRMRAFEVWFLDGHLPHSGGCFGPEQRIHLVCDFDPSVPMKHLFRDPQMLSTKIEPLYLERPTLTPAELEKLIDGLAVSMRSIGYESVDQIIQLLPFQYNFDTGKTYDVLIEVAKRSGDPLLLKRAVEAKAYFIGDE